MVVKIRLDDKNTSCKGLMFGRRWRCWAFDLVGVQKVSSNRFSRRLSCLSSVQIYNTTKLCGGCFFPCSHLWLRAIKTLFKVARNIAGEKKKSKSHKSNAGNETCKKKTLLFSRSVESPSYLHLCKNLIRC